jgi:hypothetical protein
MPASTFPVLPHNNPGGWLANGVILRDLKPILSPDSQLSHSSADTYSAEDCAKDVDLAQRIPDLSTVAFQFGDVLAALERLRT